MTDRAKSWAAIAEVCVVTIQWSLRSSRRRQTTISRYTSDRQISVSIVIHSIVISIRLICCTLFVKFMISEGWLANVERSRRWIQAALHGRSSETDAANCSSWLLILVLNLKKALSWSLNSTTSMRRGSIAALRGLKCRRSGIR